MVSNVLSSPGYPNNYPSNMLCNYVVPITNGMAMKIDFHYFDVGYLSSCRWEMIKLYNYNSGQAKYIVLIKDNVGHFSAGNWHTSLIVLSHRVETLILKFWLWSGWNIMINTLSLQITWQEWFCTWPTAGKIRFLFTLQTNLPLLRWCISKHIIEVDIIFIAYCLKMRKLLCCPPEWV